MKTTTSSYFEQLYLVRTKKEAVDCILMLRAASSALFTLKKDTKAILSEFLPYDKTEKILKLCKHLNVDSRDPENLQKVLLNIANYIQTIPSVSITLAFEPTQQDVIDIYEWFLTNIKTEMILDIKVNPELIGGMEIAFNGKHKDYSLRNKFRILYEKGEIKL